MPLKEVALEVATSVDAVARRAAAANTLVRRDDGGWDATNTDVVGLVRALGPHLTGRHERALVLGAGATARSAVLALAELGVTTLTVRARDTGRAADLLAWALDLGAGIRNGSVAALGPWVTTRDDVVVSTLPGVGGRGRGRHRARGAPRRPARRRVRRVADAARPRRRRGRHDRGLRARHARAPGGRAVPAVHRARRPRSRRWPPRGARRWGRRDAGLGRARRGPGHGRGGAPHRAPARDRWLPHRRGRGGPRARAQLVARASPRRRSPRWRRGRSATWAAGPRCRPTCCSPG